MRVPAADSVGWRKRGALDSLTTSAEGTRSGRAAVMTIDTRFEYELQKRIAEERTRLLDVFEAGVAIKDYPQYQNYLGQLQALKRVATEFCSDVTTAINQR